MTKPRKPWGQLTTPERVKAVRAMLAPPLGKSYSEIGRALGTSRVSIAGIVWRNGLRSANPVGAPKGKPQPHKPAARARKASRREQPIEPEMPNLEPAESPPDDIWRPLRGYVALEDHMDGGCKWPVDPGDGTSSHCCCNLPVASDGQAWCAAHRAVAWRPFPKTRANTRLTT